MNVPQTVIEALTSARRPLVLGHVNPDADALGSMLALAKAVPAEKAAILLPGRVLGQKLRFLLSLLPDVPVVDSVSAIEPDVVVVCDTASPARVNADAEWESIAAQASAVVNIDHHITNSDYGTINWIVDHAGSTCELVARLILAAGWPLEPAVASVLFAGMYADTCGFSLPNTSADVFHLAGDLVKAGAQTAAVSESLIRSQQMHEFELIRTVYRNTRLAGDGRIAYSSLSHKEISDAGCTPEDIDDQVSIPRSLSGISVAILFSEGEPGVVRINLRGENGTAVLPIARKLGGGGHQHSAGVRVRGEMAEIIPRVIRETEHELGQ